VKKKLLSLLVIVAIAAIILFLNYQRKVYHFSGYTMGTTYKVVIYDRFIDPEELRELKQQVSESLESLNKTFSTFNHDSELSKLNKSGANEIVSVSKKMSEVLSISAKVHKLTNGYFDPTIDPLVRLWGFGRDFRNTYPSKQEIDNELINIGYESIIISGNIISKKKLVTVDFASIAKGYAVDIISEILMNSEKKDYLVEIGGELFVNGDEYFRNGWDVQIANPAIPSNASLMTIRIKNKGVATSGSYLNFREFGGKKYQHIIDPHNGYPVENSLLSVTVIADSTVFADALATGLIGMGLEKGLNLVNSLKEIEAIFIEKAKDGVEVTKSEGL